jgi:TolA-binding protein
VFQQYSRLAQRLKDSSDDQKLQQQVDALKKRLEGLEERIKQHEKAAKEIEDRIFAVNQPKSRKYVLTRVRAAGAKVSGAVTLDGKPLADATVEFRSAKGVVATGKTNAEGSFVLRSNGNAVVPVGEYRVTISKRGVPAKYADADKVILKREVVPGENVFDYDLED